MSAATVSATRHTKKKFSLPVSKIPAVVAIGVFILMFLYGQFAYGKFFRLGTVSTLLNDNAYLFIMAVGMTIPILTGGIDLSVGAVVALSSVVGGSLAVAGVPWYLCALIMVLVGSVFGLLSGTLIRYFDMQPFIATLATMYLGQGLAGMISTDPIQLLDGNAGGLRNFNYTFTLYDGRKANDLDVSVALLIAIVVVIFAYWVMHRTRSGRTIYAMGAPSKQSADLMGLPTGRSLQLIYLLSGTFSGIASVVYVAGVGKAQNVMGQGWELNAITCAVIGGTIITGGSGYVLGTVVGTLVYTTMNLIITRDGRVPSTWMTIITGIVLLLFVVIQRLIIVGAERRTRTATLTSSGQAAGPSAAPTDSNVSAGTGAGAGTGANSGTGTSRPGAAQATRRE